MCHKLLLHGGVRSYLYVSTCCRSFQLELDASGAIVASRYSSSFPSPWLLFSLSSQFPRALSSMAVVFDGNTSTGSRWCSHRKKLFNSMASKVPADFSRTEFRDLLLDVHAAALTTYCFLHDRCSPKWLPCHFLHNNYPAPTPQMSVL